MRLFIGIAMSIGVGLGCVAAEAVSIPIGRDAATPQTSQPESLLAVVLPERSISSSVAEPTIEMDPVITGQPLDLLAMDDASIGAADLFRTSLKAVTALFHW